eukprot:gnl/MRDRNA2_/MRDRNA2_71198_c0_seq2.p1 gnl/MRDRNA2_/MRDRNA2_71198_c0~~gnl/MRDRNA2_/MRDRNA2_71198_c0_seq2.p1  ORF type:complete len:491 (+),score=118.05 gnl/MRDRNA2_/MRDRNA2_71198_c0_seq2:7-1479(+)
MSFDQRRYQDEIQVIETVVARLKGEPYNLPTPSRQDVGNGESCNSFQSPSEVCESILRDDCKPVHRENVQAKVMTPLAEDDQAAASQTPHAPPMSILKEKSELAVVISEKKSVEFSEDSEQFDTQKYPSGSNDNDHKTDPTQHLCRGRRGSLHSSLLRLSQDLLPESDDEDMSDQEVNDGHHLVEVDDQQKGDELCEEHYVSQEHDAQSPPSPNYESDADSKNIIARKRSNSLVRSSSLIRLSTELLPESSDSDEDMHEERNEENKTDGAGKNSPGQGKEQIKRENANASDTKQRDNVDHHKKEEGRIEARFKCSQRSLIFEPAQVTCTARGETTIQDDLEYLSLCLESGDAVDNGEDNVLAVNEDEDEEVDKEHCFELQCQVCLDMARNMLMVCTKCVSDGIPSLKGLASSSDVAEPSVQVTPVAQSMLGPQEMPTLLTGPKTGAVKKQTETQRRVVKLQHVAPKSNAVWEPAHKRQTNLQGLLVCKAC